jgi:hypothetical protein
VCVCSLCVFVGCVCSLCVCAGCVCVVCLILAGGGCMHLHAFTVLIGSFISSKSDALIGDGYWCVK